MSVNIDNDIDEFMDVEFDVCDLMGVEYHSNDMNDTFTNGETSIVTPQIQFILPMRSATVNHLYRGTINAFTIFDQPARFVRLHGIVREITEDPFKITYKFEDETGTMKAIHWFEKDAVINRDIEINKYVEIVGRPRHQYGIGRYVFIMKIEKAKGMSMICSHLLEVIMPSPCDEPKNENKNKRRRRRKRNIPGHTIFKPDEIGEDYSCVHNVILNEVDDDNGITKSRLLSKLPKYFTMAEIDEILKYLLSIGLIYNTLDDDHYQTTPYLDELKK